MTKFNYRAVNEAGDVVSGAHRADNQAAARADLAERGLHPLRVERRQSILKLEITKKKVKRKNLMHFSRQLSVFLRAGIPVLDALEMMLEEMSDKALRKAVVDMLDALRSGQTIANAAAAHPEAFPDVYVGILRSAELTGRLDLVLDQLSEYLERDLEARRKITGALFYPAAVLLLSIFTAGVLAVVVLPRFREFFRSLDAELPLTTRFVLGISSFLTNWWFALGGGLAALVVAFVAFTHTHRGRTWRDGTLLRLPVVGDLVRHAVIERFCRVLSSMVEAGVPLPDALTATSDATSNLKFRSRLSEAREAMLRGEGLAGPLAATNLFPTAARQMFRVGEATGTLDNQLKQAADYFDTELDYKIKRFTTLFEPAVILLMGGMVGVVAISLVTAMYGIFRQVQ